MSKATHYHLIWAVKGWRPFFEKQDFERITARLHRNFTIKKAEVLAIGGDQEHVHVLIGLIEGHSLSKAIGWAKGESSHWFNRTHSSKMNWQKGYFYEILPDHRIDGCRHYIESHEWKGNPDHFPEEIAEFRKKGISS